MTRGAMTGWSVGVFAVIVAVAVWSMADEAIEEPSAVVGSGLAGAGDPAPALAEEQVLPPLPSNLAVPSPDVENPTALLPAASAESGFDLVLETISGCAWGGHALVSLTHVASGQFSRLIVMSEREAFRGLEPGTWRIDVKSRHTEPATTSVDVYGGEPPNEVRLNLKPDLVFTGLVVDGRTGTRYEGPLQLKIESRSDDPGTLPEVHLLPIERSVACSAGRFCLAAPPLTLSAKRVRLSVHVEGVGADSTPWIPLAELPGEHVFELRPPPVVTGVVRCPMHPEHLGRIGHPGHPGHPGLIGSSVQLVPQGTDPGTPLVENDDLQLSEAWLLATLDPAARRRTITDASGRFELDAAGDAPLQLLVWHPGHVPWLADVRAGDDVEVVLSPGATLAVHVEHGGGDLPWVALSASETNPAFIRTQLVPMSTPTIGTGSGIGSGEAVCGGLPPGSYTVGLLKEDPGGNLHAVPGSASVDLAQGERRDVWLGSAPTARTLHGLAVLPAGGDRLFQAVLLDATLHPGTAVVPVGRDGRFEFKDFTGNDGIVVVGAEPSPGVLTLALAEIELDPAGPAHLPTLYMDLTAPSVVVHAPSGTGITTVVLTAETGSPLINDYLAIFSRGALSTDAEGQLRLSGLPPGRYVVRTSSPPASATFRLDAVSADPDEVWLESYN